MIIHLIHNLNPNGNSMRLLSLIRASEDTAKENHIFTFSPILPEFRPTLDAVLPAENVHEFRTHFAFEPFFLVWKSVKQYIRQDSKQALKPTTIHVWDSEFLRTGLRLAKCWRATSIATLRHWRPEIKTKRKVLQQFDALVVNTETLRKKMEEETQIYDRWHVIYDVLPPSFISDESQTSQTREEFLAELGLPADAVLATCVGPIAEWKRWLWAVWTIDSIVRVHPEIHLLLLDPDLENVSLRRLNATQEQERRAVATFVKQYEREGIVHFLPYRRDFRQILRWSNYFWNMQTAPGSGLAMLEAATSGVAIVAPQNEMDCKTFPQGTFFPLLDAPETIDLASATHQLWIAPERQATQIAEAQVAVQSFRNLNDFLQRYGSIKPVKEGT